MLGLRGGQEVGWQHPDGFSLAAWRSGRAAGRRCRFVNEFEQLLGRGGGEQLQNARRERGRDGHPRGY